MLTVSGRIAFARESKNLNKSELARLLTVTPQTVQAWESGRNSPKICRLAEIAAVLGVSPVWLLVGTEQAAGLSEHPVVSRLSKIAESGEFESAEWLLVDDLLTAICRHRSVRG